MEPSIKIDLEQVINGSDPVIIDLGCGQKKKQDGIDVDKLDLPNVDIVTDLEDGLSFLPDNSVDQIQGRSFFPHTEKYENLMREIVRVLKKDGSRHKASTKKKSPQFLHRHKNKDNITTTYIYISLLVQAEN